MPTGLKTTSSPIQVSASFTETAADTFTQFRVDLQLNPLDNEVFVVQAIDLNAASPDLNANLSSATFCSLSTTSRTTIGRTLRTMVYPQYLSSKFLLRLQPLQTLNI